MEARCGLNNLAAAFFGRHPEGPRFLQRAEGSPPSTPPLRDGKPIDRAFDHDALIDLMKEVTISEFRTKCFSLLDQVQKTKKPLRITRSGKPIAEIVPAAPQPSRADWFGSMKGTINILGDIISPANDEEEWEVLRD
jgi:prevent-host-death family protein